MSQSEEKPEKEVRRAEKSAAKIIFIDEIDAHSDQTRGDKKAKWREGGCAAARDNGRPPVPRKGGP